MRLSLAMLFTVILGLSACGVSEAEKHVTIGFELRQEGRFDESVAEFDEAIRLDPQHAGAYMGRGFSHADLGQFQRAIQDYDEAIRLDLRPGNWQAGAHVPILGSAGPGRLPASQLRQN